MSGAAPQSKLEHALALAADGFSIFPCFPGEKTPRVKFKSWATRDAAKITEYWTAHPDANIAIYTGAEDAPLVAVDVDLRPNKNGRDALLTLELEGLEFPPTRTHATPSGGEHMIYRAPHLLKQSAGRLGNGLDTRSRGGFIVAPGSVIDGKPYTIADPRPIADAPAWLVERCGVARERDPAIEALPSVDPATAAEHATRYLRDDAPLALEGAGGDQTTYKAACRVRDFGVSEADAVALMAAHWNDRCAPPWHHDDLAKKVANAYRYGVEAPGVALPQAAFPPVAVPAAPAVPMVPDSCPLSDLGLSLSFAETYGRELRHVAKWGTWMRYDGVRWAEDVKLWSFTAVKRLVRDYASQDKSLKSRKTIAAIEFLARSDERLAATVDQWDAEPWLLNTPDGAVDLRDGTMRPHRLEDYVTKSTAAAPGGDCPLWRAFLERVTDGDNDLQRFLQKIAGYSLTGSVREHALFFLYGLGGNGKGVFLNTLTAIWGDYAKVSNAETFTATSGERHPADLAMLRGARLVTVQETEEGRPWAEVRIKSLTGGDPITARHMRQDFFTYTPQFKLLIAGNHKPTLRTVDDAMRRRMHLVPFRVSIPAAERDVTLSERLRDEWGGILQWAIDGCALWQAEGLKPPAAVREATDDYLAAEDAMSTWLAERVEKKNLTWTSSADLYADWKLWAARSNEHAGTQRRFTQNLVDRGITAARRRDGARGFANIILKTEAENSANVFA